MDPAEFDMLSRSLPTSGPALGPEPSEHAMLRRVTSSSTAGLRRRRDSESAISTTSSVDAPDETSPLVRHRTSSTGSTSGAVPFLMDSSPGRFWLIFSQILGAQFIACFDGTIMASSHPVITSYFGAANSASWLSTAFLLTSTAFQPLLGRLSDSIGRKPLFVGCLVVFLLATVWCALARSIEEFVAARAVCGLGAGGSMTLGSILTSDLVPIEYVPSLISLLCCITSRPHLHEPLHLRYTTHH